MGAEYQGDNRNLMNAVLFFTDFAGWKLQGKSIADGKTSIIY